MAAMGEDIRERTDALDAAGNTTAAIGKGFAIGSAALVSLALFGAYVVQADITVKDSSILDPEVCACLCWLFVWEDCTSLSCHTLSNSSSWLERLRYASSHASPIRHTQLPEHSVTRILCGTFSYEHSVDSIRHRYHMP